MSQEKIVKALTEGKKNMPRACRLLLEACREPISWFMLKKTKDLKKAAFEVLVILTKAGAIKFNQETKRYYATQEALDVLKKLSEE